MNKAKLNRLRRMTEEAVASAREYEKTPAGKRLCKQLDKQADRLRAARVLALTKIERIKRIIQATEERVRVQVFTETEACRAALKDIRRIIREK